MLSLAELKQIVTEQKEVFEQTDRIIERDILSNPGFFDICRLREAIIITGVRRCGKSFLMRLIWKKIKKDLKAEENDFLYVNFESEKMLNFTAQNFDTLLEVYWELFGTDKHRKIYLFFDEIQNIVGWEKFINRLQETNKYKIFITGSNASLLSKEIGTALTGRNFPIRLYPLSFKEFHRYNDGQDIKGSDAITVEQKANVKKVFRDYLNLGGFPEVVINKFRPLLEEYLRNIVYRDIVLRHHIKYEASLREIVLFLSSNIGAPFSLDKIGKMTKMKNLMTVKNYLSYLEDSFLFFFIHKHSHSIKQQIYNPDKIYICDAGLYKEISLAPGENNGRVLENVVANELLNRGFDVFYFSEKQECDFIIQKKNKLAGAVQVSQSLQITNEDRELNGLVAALNKYNLPEGLVLTEDQEDELFVDGKKIKVFPTYKWLLENE